MPRSSARGPHGFVVFLAIAVALTTAACAPSSPGSEPPLRLAPAPARADAAGDGAATGDAAATPNGDAAAGEPAREAAAPDAPDAADARDAEVTARTDATDGSAAAADARVDAPAPAPSGGGPRLDSTGFVLRGNERVFPASASYPTDRSPPFTFHDVPAGTRSLALVFVDRSNGATKWVLWDIPPETRALPENLSKTVQPRELPTSSQRGSLGRTGYSGPGVKGPPLHTYEFTLYALTVDRLPGTAGVSTTQLRTRILPAHTLARGPAFVAKGQLGGP